MKKGKGEGRTSSLNINKRGINMKKTLIVLLTAVLAISMLFVSCSNETKIDSSPVEISFGASKSRSLSANVSFEDFDNLNWYYKATLVNGEFSQGATGQNFVKLNNGLSTQIAFSQGIWNFELKATKGSGENEADIYTGSRTGVLIQRQQDGSIVTVQIDVMPSSETNGTIVIDPNVNVGGKKVNKVKIGGDNPVDLSPSESNTFSKAAGTYEVILTYEKTVQSDTVDSTVIEYGSETITVTVYGGAVTTISGDISEITQTVVIEPVGKFSTTSTVAITEKNNVTLESTLTPAMDADVNNVAKTTVILPDTIKELNVSEETNVVLTTTVYPVEEAITNENFTVTGSNNTTVAAIDLQLSVGSNSVSTFVDSNNEKVAVTVTTYILKNLSNVVVKYNGIGDQPADISITTSNASEKPNANYYESDTGKLVFTTTHFSEFFVVSDAVCYVVETNTAYNASNFYQATNTTSPVTIEIISDFELSPVTQPNGLKTGAMCVNGVLNGNNHKITMPVSEEFDTVFLYSLTGTIRNLEIENAVIVYATESDACFENVTVSGNINLGNDHNVGAFVVLAWLEQDENLYFYNCNMAANVSADGGEGNYNAAFVGYGYGQKAGHTNGGLVFENCRMDGALSSGLASVFLGNDSQLKSYRIEVSGFSFGDEAFVNNYCVSKTGYKYNGMTSIQNYYGDCIFKINNSTYSENDFAQLTDSSELMPSWGEGHFTYGPSDSGLSVSLNDDGTFSFTASQYNDKVASYKVRLSLYTTLKQGGSLMQSVEETIYVEAENTETFTSNLRNLSFVDQAWVNDNNATLADPIANNVVYKDGNDNLYYMIPNNSDGTLNGKVRKASTLTILSYDANGINVSANSISIN